MPKLETTKLVAEIELRIPEYERSRNFENRKILVPIDGSFVIPKPWLSKAKEALLSLSDDFAESAGCPDGWREKNLPDMLEAWGWGLTWDSLKGETDVTIAGIYGDVIFPEGVATIAVLAPCVIGEMVFGANRYHPDPLFAICVAEGEVELTGVTRDITYRLE